MLILIISSITIAVFLNLIIPQIALQLANEKETNLNDEDIGLKGNIMKLLVYHSKRPLTSSLLLIFFIVISVYLGSFIKLRRSKITSLNSLN